MKITISSGPKAAESAIPVSAETEKPKRRKKVEAAAPAPAPEPVAEEKAAAVISGEPVADLFSADDVATVAAIQTPVYAEPKSEIAEAAKPVILTSNLQLENPDLEIIPYVDGLIVDSASAISGMPMSIYHAQPTIGPSVSSSQLRTLLLQSPAHYWNLSPLNPDREEFKQTEQVIIGRAAHHLHLGEGEFDKQFIVRPEEAPDGRAWNGNNKSCKDWIAKHEAMGLTVLKPEWMENILAIGKALENEPAIQQGALNGHAELSMFYIDAHTGVFVKSRPDVVPNDTDGADLKCVSDVTTAGIMKSLGERGYHQQGALVSEAMLQVFQREMENFFLIYVEQKRPHSVRIDTISPEEIEAGKEENAVAIALFKHCLDTGYWPGPKNDSGDGGFIKRTNFSRERAAARVKHIRQELGI